MCLNQDPQVKRLVFTKAFEERVAAGCRGLSRGQER